MTIDVVMPKMGESIQEGKILKWLKKPGDKIERDEILLEISTDKVDTEVPAPNAGIIVALLAQENDTVEVGNVIARIETDVTAAVAGPAVAAPAPAAVAPTLVAAPAPVIVAAAPIPVAAPAPVATAPVPIAAASQSGAMIDVVMPKMGESIQEGKILKWLKKPGDKIERDEILLEISTDKVDTEVPSPNAGTVAELLAAENDVIEVGKVIARISTVASAPIATPIPTPTAAPVVSAPTPVVTSPIPTPAYTNGSTAIPAPALVNGGTTDIPRTSGKRFYSPLVRTIAEAEKVVLEELEVISGTGLEGRVTKQDLLQYIDLRKTGKAPIPVPAPVVPVAAPIAPAPIASPAPKPAVATPTLNIGPDDEVIPMDRMRQLISEHMVRSKITSAHVTSVAEADVTGIVKLREKTKAAFEKREGFKLTFTPFFAKAALDGLKQYPMVNVSVDGKNIIRHKRLNLSFATALDDGNLIVPVIKNADALNITGLGRAVADLSTRARTKKLAPDDIQGGTFTITNVGSFGSLFGTPVINQPQTAIMGIGAIQKRPVVREINGDDVIVIRQMVYISLTYDHRVIDGALATQCLAAICKSLEKMNEQTVDL
jgi:2-oxoglutarate dehydrogenase E2 component (dihydrolipoamide succinyltransferase)